MLGILTISNLPVKFLVSGSFEWEDASYYNEKQNSQSPYISWFASVFFLIDDFRSHIACSPTEDLYLFKRFDTSTEPEVDQLRSEFIIQDNVLQFDISMGYVDLMNISQSLG